MAFSKDTNWMEKIRGSPIKEVRAYNLKEAHLSPSLLPSNYSHSIPANLDLENPEIYKSSLPIPGLIKGITMLGCLQSDGHLTTKWT